MGHGVQPLLIKDEPQLLAVPCGAPQDGCARGEGRDKLHRGWERRVMRKIQSSEITGQLIIQGGTTNDQSRVKFLTGIHLFRLVQQELDPQPLKDFLGRRRRKNFNGRTGERKDEIARANRITSL